MYPWGHEWNRSIGSSHGPIDVGSYADNASVYGVLDMAENVVEWCSDWYNEDYYKTAPNRNPLAKLNSMATP